MDTLPNKITLNLAVTEKSLSKALSLRLSTPYPIFILSGMHWQICGLLNLKRNIQHRFFSLSFQQNRFQSVIAGKLKNLV